MRRRVWFRVLNRLETGLMDLTIRYVDRVKSGGLARVLVRILEKLARASDTGMVRVLERGRVLALRASGLAVLWGDEVAFGWRFDAGFQRALGLGIVAGA